MRPLVLFAVPLLLIGCGSQREYGPTHAANLNDRVALPPAEKPGPQPGAGGQPAANRPSWVGAEPQPRLFPD